MARVQTIADRQFRQVPRQFPDRLQFLEPAADARARSRRVLQQDHHLVMRPPRRGVAQPEHEGSDPLLHRSSSVIARMQDQVLGADRLGALQFPAECLDRFRPDLRIERCQVNQIVHVDNQRVQVEPLAGGPQQPDLVRVGRPRAPHAWAGGKDLKGVGAQFGGGQCRLFQGAGGEGVNAESQRFILSSLLRLSTTVVDKCHTCY